MVETPFAAGKTFEMKNDHFLYLQLTRKDFQEVN